jgi:hypothetical protein
MTRQWRAAGWRLVRDHPEIGLVQAIVLVQVVIGVWLWSYAALSPLRPLWTDFSADGLWTVLAVPAMLVAALITQAACAWSAVPVFNHGSSRLIHRLGRCFIDAGIYSIGAVFLLAGAAALLSHLGWLAGPIALILLFGAAWLGLGLLFMPFAEADLGILGPPAARLTWRITQGRRTEIARLLGELALLNLVGIACFGVGLFVTNAIGVGAVAACYADLRRRMVPPLPDWQTRTEPTNRSTHGRLLRRRPFPRRPSS